MQKSERFSKEFILMLGCIGSTIGTALLFLANGVKIDSPQMIASLIPTGIGIISYISIKRARNDYRRNLKKKHAEETTKHQSKN